MNIAIPKHLFFTHCSKSKNPHYKETMELTTPDILYTSDRIKSFFDHVKTNSFDWAIFSDKYGFVFPETLIQWYDLSPDEIDKKEVEMLLDKSLSGLKKYDKIIYCPGAKPLHRTYKYLIKIMKSNGLDVVCNK